MSEAGAPHIDLSAVWQPDPARRSRAARLQGVIRLSMKQLRHRFLESLLIVLGIAVGVGVLTGMETVLRLVVRWDTEILASLPTYRAVTVRPRTFDLGELYRDGGAPAVRLTGGLLDPVTLTTEDVIAARNEVPGVGSVSVWAGSSSTVPLSAIDGQPVASRPGGGERETAAPLQLEVRSYTPDDLAFWNRELVAGRNMTWQEYAEGSPVLLVEEEDVALLFPGLPAGEAIGRTVSARSFSTAGASQVVEWRIIGVLAKEEAGLFTPFPAARSRFSENLVRAYAPHTAGAGEPVRVPEIHFLPAEGTSLEELVAGVEVFFAQRHGEERVTVTNPAETLRAFTQSTRTVSLALMGLASLGLLVASLNILNLFTARVIRRRRVSAMSVALGAERHTLFGSVMAEALLLGVGGSLLGLVLAHAIAMLIKSLLTAQLGAVDPAETPFASLGLGLVDALIGIAAGAGASCLFGIYPAYLSASMEPADGLRTE